MQQGGCVIGMLEPFAMREICRSYCHDLRLYMLLTQNASCSLVGSERAMGHCPSAKFTGSISAFLSMRAMRLMEFQSDRLRTSLPQAWARAEDLGM